MTGPEMGFLLLTSQLGDPERRPLTVSQFRNLAKRMANAQPPAADKEIEPDDVMALGYDPETAQHITGLLAGKNQLRQYLRRAEDCGCIPITRLNPAYPQILRKRLGLDSPGCLWAKGDISLLERPGIALVGSRDLREENRIFAAAAGIAVAEQGYVLISGNARGADKTAQESCLTAGGSVISVVADELSLQKEQESVLYLSLDTFDSPFSTQRALRRNHVIHGLSRVTLVAQCTLEKGGTWQGSARNLQLGWTPVCCFDDGSDAVEALYRRGARCINLADLEDLGKLWELEPNFL